MSGSVERPSMAARSSRGSCRADSSGPSCRSPQRPSTTEFLALSAGSVALWPGSRVQAMAAGRRRICDRPPGGRAPRRRGAGRADGWAPAPGRQASCGPGPRSHAEIVFGDEAVVSRAYLPALVGTSREMTGRVLRQLETEGVVERIGRGRLRLSTPRDWPGLRHHRRRVMATAGTCSSPGRRARCKSDVCPSGRRVSIDQEDHDCRVQDTRSTQRTSVHQMEPPSSSSRTIPPC